MKKTLAILLFLVMQVSYGQVTYVDDNYTFEPLGIETAGILHETDSLNFYFLSSSKEVIASCFSREFKKQIWRSTLSEGYKKDKLKFEFHEAFFSSGKAHLIFKAFDKKESSLVFELITLNHEGKSQEAVKIGNFPVSDNNNYNVKYIKTEDKKHTLLRVTTDGDASPTIKSHFVWLDANFQKLQQGVIDTKIKGSNGEIKSEAVSNQLNYSISVYDHIDQKRDFIVYTYSTGNGNTELVLISNNTSLLEANISYNTTNSHLIVNGFYGQRKGKKIHIEGFYQRNYNISSNKKIADQRNGITDLISKGLSSDKAKLEQWLTGNGRKSIVYHSSYFSNTKGKFVVYEVKELINNQMTNLAGWVTTDLLILNNNLNGEANFTSILPYPELLIMGTMKGYTSFYGYFIDDDFAFSYSLDGIKSQELFPEKPELKNLTNKEIVLFETKFDSSNKPKTRTLLVETKNTAAWSMLNNYGYKIDIEPWNRATKINVKLYLLAKKGNQNP